MLWFSCKNELLITKKGLVSVLQVVEVVMSQLMEDMLVLECLQLQFVGMSLQPLLSMPFSL
jgi:hypothetical protein